jgi:hypothetical protein
VKRTAMVEAAEGFGNAKGGRNRTVRQRSASLSRLPCLSVRNTVTYDLPTKLTNSTTFSGMVMIGSIADIQHIGYFERLSTPHESGVSGAPHDT